MKDRTMKPVNKKASEIFKAAIAMIPAGQTSVKIDNKPGQYMALHVERIGANRLGAVYSFAHYYEQNGDLMRDPDVTMLFIEAAGQLFPLSYRQDGLGIDREYVEFTETGWKIYKHAQADLAVFCGNWAQNIKHQQGINPANPPDALPVVSCNSKIAAWLDQDGGLQKAGLMAVQ